MLPFIKIPITSITQKNMNDHWKTEIITERVLDTIETILNIETLSAFFSNYIHMLLTFIHLRVVGGTIIIFPHDKLDL